MSAKRLTRPMIERTVHIIDASGIVDILAPKPPAGRPGRKGRIRDNIRLWLIGVILCTRLGQETTMKGVHETLTEALARDLQWELGILRPLTTQSTAEPRDFDPERPTLTKNGKARKEIWTDDGYERLGYEDLVNAVDRIRKAFDYGHGTAPGLDDDERKRRRSAIEEVTDRLIAVTVIPRPGTTCAIDATGQWSWNRGPKKQRTEAQKRLDACTHHSPSEDVDGQMTGARATSEPGQETAPEPALEVTALPGDAGDQEPPDQDCVPAPSQRVCLDAAWGYKTGKDGAKEVGFGFHQHTIVRTPDPSAPERSEPLLVEGITVVPANEDVVEASLRLVDRISKRSKITRLAGDLLYTNLKANRWAVPLAERGIEQILAMREDNHGIVDIDGAVMQHGWLHCPTAPMDQRPLPKKFAGAEDDEHYEAVDEFKLNWAFHRKEAGLGGNLSTKWICPAMANRVGCFARGAANVEAARDAGLPIVTPPADWETRPCCTSKTVDFTPDPANTHHQRKLMQREYLGTRRWRRAMNVRSLVEGAFGILKNASRQRMRRGQNRLPGLAMANLINGLKVAVFNEEQLRSWHEDTGRGPADHPLLQPDPYDWGFSDLTRERAKEIDARYLLAAHTKDDTVVEEAA